MIYPHVLAKIIPEFIPKSRKIDFGDIKQRPILYPQNPKIWFWG
jgi:hypothetical protein